MYAHTEPNEDGILLAEGPMASLLAVADAHGGASASELALAWVADRCAENWCERPVGTNLWHQESMRLFHEIDEAIVSANKRTGQESRTTLLLALVHHSQPVVFFASIGDCSAFIVERGTFCQGVGPQCGPQTKFMGCLTRTESLDVKVWSISLTGSDALLLVSDGVTTPGTGFNNPAQEIGNVSHADIDMNSSSTASDLMVQRVVKAARQAQEKNRSGDNISVACLRFVPHR